MRVDFFIIWEHGFPYFVDILKMLSCSALEISDIKEYSFSEDDFHTFVLSLYSAEKREHIFQKTKYIMSQSKHGSRIKVIEVMNMFPRSRGFYGGPAKCETVERFKIKVRNAYNPRDSKVHTYPLDNGVSHNHIIHSSDNEDDIHHLHSILRQFTDN